MKATSPTQETTAAVAMAASPDAQLCAAAVAGDRQAFRQIVERYQNLICAITYSAFGDVGRSEELAQESFVTAWRKLSSLKDPTKLKSWLCGIARRLVANKRRRQATDVMSRVQSLENKDVESAEEESPLDHAIRDEEQAILWGVLAEISPTYREPLVLYYRGQQSIAEVAANLDLSEDAVKQRLARGRKLLKSEIAAFVEKSLRTTRPGRAFTLAVLAALPGLGAATAAAGTVGATSKATGPLTAKIAASGFSAALWGPLLGVLGTAFGFWAGDQLTRFPRERAYYRKMIRRQLVPMLVFMLPFLPMMAGVWNPAQQFGPVDYALALTSWIVTFIVVGIVWNLRMGRQWDQIVAEEVADGASELPLTPLRQFASKWEGRRWTSRWTFLGLPLIDIQFSDPQPAQLMSYSVDWRRPAARGWIAMGDRAWGVFALGNVAIGGIAFGGISVGAIAVGGLSFGGLCLGGVAIGMVALSGLAVGWLACGGMAAGWLAFGGAAFAWRAAKGGLAVAHDFAVGGQAIATHANDAAANAYLADASLLTNAERVIQFLAGGSPWMLPAVIAGTFLACAVAWLLAYRRTGAKASLEKT